MNYMGNKLWIWILNPRNYSHYHLSHIIQFTRINTIRRKAVIWRLATGVSTHAHSTLSGQNILVCTHLMNAKGWKNFTPNNTYLANQIYWADSEAIIVRLWYEVFPIICNTCCGICCSVVIAPQLMKTACTLSSNRCWSISRGKPHGKWLIQLDRQVDRYRRNFHGLSPWSGMLSVSKRLPERYIERMSLWSSF